MLEKIKPFYGLLLLLSIAGIFFALGRLSAPKLAENSLKISYVTPLQSASVINSANASTSTNISIISTNVPEDGPVIGSKSGKKYYFPWCGTVKRIKPENQVHFKSIVEARSSGFTPGGNCKGLK